MTVVLSATARAALSRAYASRGQHKGQLLARCPASYGPKADPLAAAAWQGAMMACNPHRVSIAAHIFMSLEQKALAYEVTAYFDSLPCEQRIAAQRDRAFL